MGNRVCYSFYCFMEVLDYFLEILFWVLGLHYCDIIIDLDWRIGVSGVFFVRFLIKLKDIDENI